MTCEPLPPHDSPPPLRPRAPDSVAPASYYCEIHIYVTSKPKTDTPKEPLKRSSKVYSEAFRRPVFTAQQLYDEMLVPTVKAKNQRKAMKEAESPNRFQDVWIWDGRPEWDEIFSDIKENREHRDIGVCFCGMALIGATLNRMCRKYTNIAEECVFSLHKENF